MLFGQILCGLAIALLCKIIFFELDSRLRGNDKERNGNDKKKNRNSKKRNCGDRRFSFLSFPRRRESSLQRSYWLLIIVLVLQPQDSLAKPAIEWQRVQTGFHIGKYEFSGGFLKSELLLLKLDPKKFSFELATVAKERTDIKELTDSLNGFAGINAHFFDEIGKPLGLVIKDSKQIQKLHRGGRLLTGVFYLKDKKPYITHRSTFKADGVKTALQAGPRLISNGKRLQLAAANATSRRSGIAINKAGEVIIFITLVRFPGTSMRQIQDFLLIPELAIVDALNLDGGGSSQLYMKRNSITKMETLITGGDRVPTAIVIKRR